MKRLSTSRNLFREEVLLSLIHHQACMTNTAPCEQLTLSKSCSVITPEKGGRSISTKHSTGTPKNAPLILEEQRIASWQRASLKGRVFVRLYRCCLRMGGRFRKLRSHVTSSAIL